MTVRIDAHQHFWAYDPAEYAWIDPAGMAPIARSFGPADLLPHLAAHRMDGCVAVQAREDERENEFLLGLADAAPHLKGVVGWVDLAHPSAAASLDRWVLHPRFKGLRHIAQGQPAGFLLRDSFVAGVGRLERLHLTYDILIYADQLREAATFVDRCSGHQRFVLDHIAKPRIAAGDLEPWRADIRELARRPNVWCKLSGMVTEAQAANWTPADIEPFMDAVLEAFGPARLMYGSDWPVCLLAGSYARVYDLAASFVLRLSADEQAAIMGGNATDFYGLDLTS
jgi:L-fuconolactonase